MNKTWYGSTRPGLPNKRVSARIVTCLSSWPRGRRSDKKADNAITIRLDWKVMPTPPTLSLSLDSLDNRSPSTYCPLTSIPDSNQVDSTMAPKGGNGKKESGRAKKAENEANKRAAAAEAKVHTIFRGSCPSFHFQLRHTHTSLGTGRIKQVGRRRKGQQIQGREGGEAKGGACSQSRERAIARRRRGDAHPKESHSKGRLEESRQCTVKARGPRCHRRWGCARSCSRTVYTRLQQGCWSN